MEKAAIYHELTCRNFLRRAAQLPPLDIPQEYAKAVAFAGWQDHHAKMRLRFKSDVDRINADVLTQYRDRYGSRFGSSFYGALLTRAVASRRLHSILRANGIYCPNLQSGVPYGSARRHQ